VLHGDVVDREQVEWDAVRDERVPIGLHRRMARRLQQELRAVG
jgi:hypothetical protein